MRGPVGAIIVGVLVFVRGLFALLVGILALGFGSMTLLGSAATGSAIGLDAGTVALIWAMLRLVTGAFFLALGYGLLKGAAWAWMWTVLVLLFTIIMDVIPLFTGGSVAWIGLLFSVVILIYMFTNSVRDAFLESPGTQ